MPLRRLLLPAAAAALVALPLAAEAKTSHDGWPKIDGKLWINHSDRDAHKVGTARNDELLGGHGNDTIEGGDGRDVLWGDYHPSGNGTAQVDTLDGGPKKDFIYASHGRNVILGGGGPDVIHAHFGRGVIDCGSGRDTVFVSHRSKRGYKIRHCERISFKTLGY